MRKLICAVLVLALLAVPMFAISATAGSAVDENIIVSDLIPDDTTYIETTDCEAKINKDGTLTVTITGANPAMKIKLAEGNTLYTGHDVNVSEDAYVAVDFGTAGQIVISSMILHYTRKDKQELGTFADLYLDSMYSNNYAAHRKQVDGASYDATNPFVNGSSHYVVWDWGKYLMDYGPNKYFEDKMHKFVDIDITFGTEQTQKCTIGSQITFYTIAVVSDANVKLGTVTPDPIVDDPDPSDDPANSDDPDPSDDPANSDEPSTPDESSADEPATSDVTSDESPAEDSSTATGSDESSKATTSGTASGTTSSASSATVSEGEEGGSNTGLIIGIVVAAVVVIGGAAAGIVIAKKKK